MDVNIRTVIISILVSIITAHVVVRVQMCKFIDLIQEENEKFLKKVKDILFNEVYKKFKF